MAGHAPTVDRERQRHPELDAFFASNRPERFFVKNLERVQGDERDAIVLTVGYGKDPSGRVPYRFGPLLMEGGERRLNVAVTRARPTICRQRKAGRVVLYSSCTVWKYFSPCKRPSSLIV